MDRYTNDHVWLDPVSAPDDFADLETQYHEQIELLITLVRLSRLGGIATVECNNIELRKRLFRYFKRRFAEHNIYLYPVKVSETDLNLVRVLRNLTDTPGFKDLELVGRYRNIVLFVYGIEAYTEAQQEKFLHFLNLFRDGTTIIKQPIVLWATSDFIQKMAVEAPDFWAWKGMLFRFDAHSDEAESPERRPLRKYLYTLSHLPEFAIWQDLFVPLRGSQLRALEASLDILSHAEASWEGLWLLPRHLTDEEKVWIRVATTPVLYFLTHNNRVLLLGAPGAGKTTVLRYFAYTVADRAFHQLDRKEAEGIMVPIFVRLNMMRHGRQVEDLILEVLNHYGLTSIRRAEEVRTLLSQDEVQLETGMPPVRLALLFDGLNEIPPEAQEMFFQLVRLSAPAHRVVISCRTDHFVPVEGFLPVLLEPLSEDDVEFYVTRYLAPERGRQLAREILADPDLRQMAHSPLLLFMLTQIADAHPEATLPKNRGRLYEAFTERLLHRTETEWWRLFGRSKAKVQVDISREALGYLALAMQHQHLETISREQCYWLIREATFTAHLQAPAKDVLEGLLFSGLLRLTDDRRRVEFLHQAVREYFAAYQLRALNERIAPYLDDPQDVIHWAGTAILFFGISQDHTQVFLDIVGDGRDYRRLWIAAEALASVALESEIWQKIAEELADDAHQLALFKFCCGLALKHRGAYKKALAYFEKAVLLDDTLAVVPYEMGIVYRHLGQHDYAIVALREAIRLWPEFVDSYNQLGITYFETGDYQRACFVFEAATALEPDNPHHFYNLGQAYKMLGRLEEAAQAFTRAIHLNPGYQAARAQLDLIRTALESETFEHLSRIPLFQALSLDHRVLLAQHLRYQAFLPGETIVQQGAPANCFFVVRTGEVELLRQQDGTTSFKRLGPGEYFGEAALLEKEVAYPYTARATRRTLVFALRREDVMRIRSQAPELASTLVQTHAKRLPTRE